jgi:hypothetical protein
MKKPSAGARCRFAIRKTAVLVEEVRLEGGRADGPPLVRVAAMAAIGNPYAGKALANIDPLIEFGAELGSLLAQKLLTYFGNDARRVESYGKGAIVGTLGEIEHGYATITRPFATRVRAALGDATAWMAANVKRGALGASLDVPLACKDAVYVRSHYDTITATMPDGPLPDEVVVILVGAGRGRLHARIGGLRKADVKGRRDIYVDK